MSDEQKRENERQGAQGDINARVSAFVSMCRRGEHTLSLNTYGSERMVQPLMDALEIEDAYSGQLKIRLCLFCTYQERVLLLRTRDERLETMFGPPVQEIYIL